MVCIIIPAYNEGEILRQTIEKLLPLGHHIIVVDDASRESPRKLLAGLPITLLRHPLNLGQGAALQTGMEYAKILGADSVIHFDADGQHDYHDIPRFLQKIQDGADVVLGSRFLRQQDILLVPAAKRFFLRLAKFANGLLCGLWLSDAHNGFRALNRKALNAIKLRENRMAHASEIISQIKKYQLKFVEIPTAVHYTDYSRRKGQKISNCLNIVMDILIRKLL